MGVFEDARAEVAEACYQAQEGRSWASERVRRVGVVWVVEEDDREAGKLVARDVAHDQRERWDRREFLSRGLEVLERPGS